MRVETDSFFLFETALKWAQKKIVMQRKRGGV